MATNLGSLKIFKIIIIVWQMDADHFVANRLWREPESVFISLNSAENEEQ